jgi:hypothetical protein
MSDEDHTTTLSPDVMPDSVSYITDTFTNDTLISNNPRSTFLINEDRFDLRGQLGGIKLMKSVILRYFVIETTTIRLNKGCTFHIKIVTDSKDVYRELSLDSITYALWLNDDFPFEYVLENIIDIYNETM